MKINGIKSFNVSVVDKVIIYNILLLPIYSYYKAPIVFDSLVTFMLGILVILVLIINPIKEICLNSKVSKLWFVFYVWFNITTLLSYFTGYGGDLSNLNSYINGNVIFIFIYLVFQKKNRDFFLSFIDLYIKFCWLFSIIFILQHIAYYLFNYNLILKIPFLNLLSFYDSTNFGAQISNYSAIVSFSGPFSERAHFVQYILFTIPIYIFGMQPVRKNIYKAILLSLVVLITTSAQGFIGVIFIWSYIVLFRKNINILKKLFLCLLFLIFFWVIHTWLFNNIVEYRNSIGTLLYSDSIVNQKTSYRVFRGLDIYFMIPTAKKIFGIGYRQYSNYAHHFQLHSEYDLLNTQNIEYLSGANQILIYFGLLGLLITIFIVISSITRESQLKRLMVLLFCLLMFAASIFLDSTFLVVMLVIISCYKIDSEIFDKKVRGNMNLPQ